MKAAPQGATVAGASGRPAGMGASGTMSSVKVFFGRDTKSETVYQYCGHCGANFAGKMKSPPIGCRKG